jgi:hypothetical protein
MEQTILVFLLFILRYFTLKKTILQRRGAAAQVHIRFGSPALFPVSGFLASVSQVWYISGPEHPKKKTNIINRNKKTSSSTTAWRIAVPAAFFSMPA